MSIFDMLLANAMGDSGGGGGGGSEFKTAQVTVASPYQNFDLNDYDNEQPPYGCSCFAVENGQIVAYRFSVWEEDSKTYTLYYLGDSVTLYVGTVYISSSGNVTYDEDTNSVTITGDCTVTGYIDD